MGTCSYVLTGTSKGMAETFGSTCHGAGMPMHVVSVDIEDMAGTPADENDYSTQAAFDAIDSFVLWDRSGHESGEVSSADCLH